MDARWKFIRRWKVTAANVDDGKTLPEIIDRANTTARLMADRGYDHEANREVLAEHGWRDGIARKAKPGKKLGERAQARNKAINRTRARVEHDPAGLSRARRRNCAWVASSGRARLASWAG